MVGTRHLYRRSCVQSWQHLMLLLERVDQFNQVLHSLEVHRQLGTVQLANPNYWAEVLEVAQQTRGNLVAGLRAEKILRDGGGLTTHQQKLMADLEHHFLRLEDNFDTLSTLSDWL